MLIFKYITIQKREKIQKIKLTLILPQKILYLTQNN